MAQSIKQLIVIPKTIHYGIFYINDNLNDSQMMEYDDLYLFIAGMLKPPATIQVHELIYTHNSFFVNIEENYVEKLLFDSTEEIEKLRKSLITGLTSKVSKLILKARRENNKEMSIFKSAVDNLENKLVYCNPYALGGKKKDKDNPNEDKIYTSLNGF